MDEEKLLQLLKDKLSINIGVMTDADWYGKRLKIRISLRLDDEEISSSTDSIGLSELGIEE